LAVGADASDPYFSGFDRNLQGLSSVVTFLNTGLGAYQARLKQVGQDLARCQGNPAVAVPFRSALLSGDPTNSLVMAQAWVDANGGESLAQGTLRELLQQPLDVARDALGTSSDPNKRWTELVRASEQLSRKFPFDKNADELASADEVKVVLGGQSGIVPTLYAEKDKLQLGDASRQWLERANELSGIFFDPGKDDPKAYKLSLTLNVDGVSIEPAKAAETHRWRLEGFTFLLADIFDWKADQGAPNTKACSLALFGDEAVGASKIVMSVGQLDKKIGKDEWKKQPPQSVVSADGAWAPLKVLAKIRPKGAIADRITFPLTATFPFKSKGSTVGKLAVTMDVQGKKLAKVLDLIDEGLPPAPAKP
jgi:hypothetical protein